MGILGRHTAHLPRQNYNKKAQGVDSDFGRHVVKGQGQQTKADAKNARSWWGGKKK